MQNEHLKSWQLSHDHAYERCVRKIQEKKLKTCYSSSLAIEADTDTFQ